MFCDGAFVTHILKSYSILLLNALTCVASLTAFSPFEASFRFLSFCLIFNFCAAEVSFRPPKKRGLSSSQALFRMRAHVWKEHTARLGCISRGKETGQNSPPIGWSYSRAAELTNGKVQQAEAVCLCPMGKNHVSKSLLRERQILEERDACH